MAIREVLEFIVKGDAKGAIDAFRGVEKAADDTDDKVGKSGGRFDGFFNKLNDKFPSVGKAAEKFGISSGTAMAAAGAGVTAAASAVGMFAAKSVAAYQQVAGEILQFQRVSGTTAEEASRWVEVAGDYGVGSDQMGAAIGRLAKQAADAPDKLAALGVQVARNADGGVDLEKTMLRAAEAFRTQTDDAKRAELGMALFGKSWQQLVPLLVQGSDGLAKSLEGVSDAKILSDEDLKQAEEFRLAMDDLKGVSEDLMIQVGKGLVPALKDLADAAKNVDAAFRPIGGFKTVVSAMTAPVRQVSGAIEGLTTGFGLWGDSADEATDKAGTWNDEMDRSAAAAGENAKLNAVLAQTNEELAKSDEELAKQQEIVASTAKKAADALDERRKATEAAYEAARASVDPILRERAAQRDLAAAAKDVADKTKEAADAKFKDAAKNNEVVSAQDGLIEKLTDVAGAYVEAKGKALDSREGAELYVAKLRELRDQYGVNLGPAISIYDELIRRIDETIRKQSAVAGVGTADRPYNPGGGVRVNSFGDGLPGGGFAPTVPGFGGAPAAGMTVNVTLTAPLVTQQAAQWVADQLAVLIRTNGVGALPFTGVTAKV